MINISEDEFLNWVTYVFNHPISQPKWWHDEDVTKETEDEEIASNSEKSISCLIKLFEKPDHYLEAYTDEQINQGLHFLVSPGASSYMFTITDRSIDIQDRLRLVSSFHTVYEKLFLPRCSDHLSYLMKTIEETRSRNPLNNMCYMWWDILPFTALNIHGEESLAITTLTTLKNILNLDSRPCREGALHGLLDAWISRYPKEVKEILKDFVTANPNLDEDLINYAPGLLKHI